MADINVAFAVNDSYVEHLNVTIYSILRNNPRNNFTFYVLCDSLTDRSKEKINLIKSFYQNVSIDVIELKDKEYGFNKFKIPQNVSFITKEMYFRYALPEVLQGVDKVLYLDADLVALGDLEGLYKEDVNKYYVAGAVDAGIAPRFPEHLPSLGMSSNDIYINSGVLLMNLARMRHDNITKKLLDNTKQYEKQLLFPDQDAINLTLKGFIKPIKPIYNFTDQNMLEDKIDIDDVKVVHFTGGIKPWHNVFQNHTKKYVDKYRQYENEYHDLILRERNTLVSIIVPVHNTLEVDLQKCFDSIKRQSYKNTEVVIIDDGSKKMTADFVDVYTENLDNWRVVHQKNTGVNMARKAGFSESKGEFVTFVDSDDILVSRFCERLLKSAIKADADVVVAEKYEFSSDVPYHIANKDEQPDDVLEDKKGILKAHRITPFDMESWGVAIWGAIYKREVVQQIDWQFSDYTIAEDEFWTIQTKIHASKIAYVHQQLYCYRINISSRSKVIKSMYFKGYGENREVPFVSLGLEIYRKNTALFEKYGVDLPEEPLLYGVSVTKRLIKQCFNANELTKKNVELVQNIATEFLKAIKDKNIAIDKDIIFELELIKTNPEIFIQYVHAIEQSQKELARLTDEVALYGTELDSLRQPSIKFATRKLAGAFKRRLQRGFLGKLQQKIKNYTPPSSVEDFDQNYKNLRGIKSISSSKKSKGRYIVTLTSYGDRITATAPRAIYSILSGKELPDKIILWLAHGESIPESLHAMKRYGLDIRFTEDIKSYKKLIPALREYPNDILITADDDVYYPREWFAELKKIHKKNPKKIIANRADVITFDSKGEVQDYSQFKHGSANSETSYFIPTGVGGVLYPSGSLNENVLNESEFTKLSYDNDDIWFWAMGMLNNTDFTLTNSLYGNISRNPLISISHDSSEPALWDKKNSASGENQSTVALKNVLEKWPEIKSRI